MNCLLFTSHELLSVGVHFNPYWNMMWKWDRKWRTSVEIWWQSSDGRQFTIWSRGTQWVIDYGANPVLHLIWLNFPLIGYRNWLFLCTGQPQPLCQVAATDWFVQTWKCLCWEKQPWLVQKMEGIVAGTEPRVSGACMCRYQVQPPSLLLFPLSPFPADCHRFRQLTSTNWKPTGISSLFDEMFCTSVSCSNLFFGSWVPYQDLLIWNGQCKPPLFVVLYGSKKKLINQLAPFQASLSSTEENGLKLICWLNLGGKCSCFFKHAVALSIDQHWVFTTELSLDPMIEFTLSFTQCVVLCALALPPLWPWCNQLKSAWCWWKCSSKTSWLCTPSSNLPPSVLVHSVYLCYKTTPLRRPVPQPPTLPTTLNAPTYVTWLRSLFRDQSLNFPIVYSTTHKASLLQD